MSRFVRRPLALLFLLAAPAAFAQDAPLTIERAVELAVTRNERAAIADTTVEQAEARVRQARSFLLPRVDITSTLDQDFQGTDRTNFNTNALLRQTIFNARAFPLFRQARLERDAARLTATETKRLLAFDAATAFLSTLSVDQVLLAAERRRDFAQVNLNDVRARFEAGLVSSNDVTRAELEMATAVRGVAEARGDAQSARIDLATLLNTPVTSVVAPVELLDAADDAPAAADAEVTRAQQQRTDIAAARTEVEALRAFADEPAARFLPSLEFNAQARNVNDGPVSNRANEGFLGLTMNWAVFDAGVRAAERAERLAQLRGAELDLVARMRQVEREVRNAAVRLTTEQAALREALAAVRAARKNADETSELYRQGLASALELADANQRLFEAEVAEVTARFRMAVAYLASREAAGVAVLGRDE
jgi:outer membrane protein TolC